MCHNHWKAHRHHKHQRWARWQEMQRNRWYQPPANVVESEEAFILSVIAAGRKKEDFRLSVKDNVLTVFVKKPENSLAEGQDYKRREYRLSSFERHFELTTKVNQEAISAEYTDGILYITLPKVEGADAPDQEIAVA